MLERIVIVGASLAGLRAAQTLRREGFEGALTVVGAEEHRPYNRPPLSKDVLAGTSEITKVDLGSAKVDAEWLVGRPASGLDLVRREVELTDGERLEFDGLVIATGSTPHTLRASGRLDGIFGLRTLDDCLALKSALDARPARVVVVGAGFIGCEVASTCRSLGHDVTVVDVLEYPIAPVGAELGAFCADLQRAAGVDLRLGHSVVGFEGTDNVERVVMENDVTIEADVVVVGIGVRPATDWLEGSGIVLDDGVVCNSSSAAVGFEHVVAAGDVARWPLPLLDGQLVRLEHWSNAGEQGAAAARTLLAGPGAGPPYESIPSFWSEQFGVRIQSLGMPQLADRMEIVDGSPDDGTFVALFGEGGRTIGAVACNAAARLGATRGPISERAPFDEAVSSLRS